jgi:hypothetical protein
VAVLSAPLRASWRPGVVHGHSFREVQHRLPGHSAAERAGMADLDRELRELVSMSRAT